MTTAVREIFSGQSNAVSQTDTRATTAALALQPDVPAWIYERYSYLSDMRQKRLPWGCARKEKGYPVTYTPLINSRDWPGAELACVRRLADVHGRKPHMIQVADGATSLATDWAPAGGGFGDYAILVREYHAAVASDRCPAVNAANIFLVWRHGETDGSGDAALANAYQTNWDTFIAALRADLGLPSLRAILLRLHDSSSVPFKATIQAKQAAIDVADPLVTLIDPTPLGALAPDGLHYTQALAIAVGNAEADVINGLVT